jgi:hypothetical protein
MRSRTVAPGEPVAAEPEMRIIITGSRTWTDVAAIEAVLLPILAAHPDAVLVNGFAGGVDRIGDRVWRQAGGRTERHPIGAREWRQACRGDCDHGPRPTRYDGSDFCPSPGPRRNQRMADGGGDLCVAFRMPGKSNGTDDMIARARAAGIPVEMHNAYQPDTDGALF